MSTVEVPYRLMLGLTLFKNFINNLKVGYYNAIECQYFQAVKINQKRLKKNLQKIHILGCEYSGKCQVRFSIG